MRAPAKTFDAARHLRRTLSPPEVQLWNRLRRRLPGKPAFRRQHAIGPYVLDFYCAKARLAVEIDGISHDMGGRPQRDKRRDAWLKKRGICVAHIAADKVLRSVDVAADATVRMVLERI
jgi:very-short-patch-repair endonuclease